jgi:hypothetical protein
VGGFSELRKGGRKSGGVFRGEGRRFAPRSGPFSAAQRKIFWIYGNFGIKTAPQILQYSYQNSCFSTCISVNLRKMLL